jgi:hypothetical protein
MRPHLKGSEHSGDLGLDTKMGSYPIANTLYEILSPHPPRIANLIPFLKQWRDAIWRLK